MKNWAKMIATGVLMALFGIAFAKLLVLIDSKVIKPLQKGTCACAQCPDKEQP